jgi:hypothetical protein
MRRKWYQDTFSRTAFPADEVAPRAKARFEWKHYPKKKYPGTFFESGERSKSC